VELHYWLKRTWKLFSLSWDKLEQSHKYNALKMTLIMATTLCVLFPVDHMKWCIIWEEKTSLQWLLRFISSQAEHLEKNCIDWIHKKK
jgi:hypothetical protein